MSGRVIASVAKQSQSSKVEIATALWGLAMTVMMLSAEQYQKSKLHSKMQKY